MKVRSLSGRDEAAFGIPFPLHRGSTRWSVESANKHACPLFTQKSTNLRATTAQTYYQCSVMLWSNRAEQHAAVRRSAPTRSRAFVSLLPAATHSDVVDSVPERSIAANRWSSAGDCA